MIGWVAGTALLLSAVAAAPPAPAARANVDPFYLDLLREGIQTYERGEYNNAARQLRLACFGLLDDPPQLAACLTRLALAQGAAGNAEGFRDTFRRISEVEETFGAYGKAGLPAEVRTAFEQRVLAIIPASTLEALPAWKPLASRQLEAQIAALPPRERRRQLEARLAREPKSPTWNLMLADLELAEGKTAAAIARADQAVVLAPQDPRALCLRGLARASGKRCAEAVLDLDPCPLCAREARYAGALLSCRLELSQWSKADEQVRSLPPALLQDRKIAALAAQVKRHASAPNPPAPITAPAPTAAKGPPGAPAASQAAAGAKPGPAKPTGPAAVVQAATAPKTPEGRGQTAKSPSLSAAERETLERSRHILDTQSQAKELREAFRLARGVADAHPDSKEAQYLAGEAAYRNERWKDAAGYLRRAGEPGDDHPELLFYLAVSLYEAGDREAAAQFLKRSLPNLQKNAYIDSYAKRILGRPGQGG